MTINVLTVLQDVKPAQIPRFVQPVQNNSIQLNWDVQLVQLDVPSVLLTLILCVVPVLMVIIYLTIHV